MAGGNYLNLRTSLNFSIYGMDVLSLHFSSLNKILSFLHISTCSIRHKFIFFKNSNHVTCHVDYILKYERQIKYIFKHNDNLNFLNSRSVFLCSAVILCTCQCKESPEGANKISIFCIVGFFFCCCQFKLPALGHLFFYAIIRIWDPFANCYPFCLFSPCSCI